MHIYIAGGTGAIGTRLIPQLVERGHRVTATTTNPAKVAGLETLGAHAVTVNGLDSAAVGESVATAEPDAVVHQMSSLAGKLDPKHFDRSFAVTNRLRTEGLDNLVAAAQATGVQHIVAQSYTGWPNIARADGSRTRRTRWTRTLRRRSASRLQPSATSKRRCRRQTARS